MECNKEEATRARDLAERKLSEKDYTGAHKIALKARKLYPDLENLNQIVTVCEVHCAAIAKVNGETDWYGILQVGTTADDQAIKKAYRKLALLLHPDKNKFTGAEAAFKLIGEANGILTDKGKRSLHDMKRNARSSLGQVRRAPAPAARATRGSAANVASNGSNSNRASVNQTFWTMCTTCGMRYQYYRSMLKKALRCQNCLNPFVAYEADEKGRSSATGNGVNPNPNLRFDPSNGTSREPFRSFTAPKCNQFRGGVNNANNSAGTTANGDQKFEKVNLRNAHRGSGSVPGPGLGTRPAAAQASTTKVPPVKPSKRKRVVLDEEEFEDSTDSSSSEDETILKQKTQPSSTNPPRRSSRQKQNVSYNERADADDDLDDDFDVDDGDGDDDEDDDFLEGHNKKQRSHESSEAADVPIEREKEADASSEPRVFTYRDPQFFNFETLREQNKFAVGQVWAVYDDCDGMPRFYARIKSLHTIPKFSIRFFWFEVDLDKSTQAWHRAGLPIATGTFKLGDEQTDDNILMFSHVVLKGSKKNTVSIYPRKGEVWAMFKNWDSSWSSKSGKNRKFEYEMVEVVSDVTDFTGFVVRPLVKINGFVSIFMQSREAAPVVIPSSEVLRFSHSVPLYRITGNESNRVPEGAFELDPASLPPDLIGAFTSNGLDPKQMQKLSTNPLSEHTEEKNDERKNHGCGKKGDVEEISSPESPDGEFYRFSDARSIEIIKRGQIWALYSEIDALPKYYAMVNKIDREKGCVFIKWLEHYGESVVGVDESQNTFPFGCGIFRLANNAADWYEINAFSHEMAAKPGAGKNLYEIKPAKTETWAVYRNWNRNWSADDVKECQYDLVRISQVNQAGVTVLFLDKVVGYKAVFRLDSRRKPMEIPNGELAKFSHRIPTHHLTHEANGTLNGYWQLDTEALPKSFLC